MNTNSITNTPADYLTATLPQHVGRDFGTSAPVLVDQARIDHFAHCTGDNQWLHVDPERARTEGPFSTTIAHGMLTLSLVPAAQFELNVFPKDATSILNYGFDKVRFLAPVPSGTAVVLRVELVEVEVKQPGRYLLRCRNSAFLSNDSARPVMVADSLAMVMS